MLLRSMLHNDTLLNSYSSAYAKQARRIVIEISYKIDCPFIFQKRVFIPWNEKLG